MANSLRVILHLFLRSSRVRRKRAILTVASIAWGTVAILLLLAFGEGLARQITRNTLAVGENIAVFRSGETSRAWNGLAPGRSIEPAIEDVALLGGSIPDLDAVVGEMSSARVPLTYGAQTVGARIIGANYRYGAVRKHAARAGGRFFGARDEADRRRVIFLGDVLARDLFGAVPPEGRKVLMNGATYTVIGVMQHKTQSNGYGGLDQDHAVIPLTTYRAQFGDGPLSALVVQVKTPDSMAGLLGHVRATLGAKHGFDPTDKRALRIWDTVASSAINRKVVRGIELFLGLIGAATLIVAGVGVANIMYAVVKERTKEIGVEMALGARRRWITAPFVLEGLSYTLMGGAIGLAIAVAAIAAFGLLPTEGNRVMEFVGTPTLSWPIGIATAAILGVVGTLAGYFPARRAAGIDPAATLRYE